MVESGHRRSERILEIRHRPPRDAAAGVEVLPLRSLPARAGAGLVKVQRLAFHQLLALERGTLLHTVDFTDYVVEPGQWLWVRPGQVQQWRDLGQADGTLAVFEGGVLATDVAELGSIDDPHAPAVWVPIDDDAVSLRLALADLVDAFERHDLPPDVRGAVVRSTLAALVLRLTHLPAVGSDTPAPSAVFLAFRDAVEQRFAETRRVEDYARDLAYAPRTLSRATLDAAGVGAKAFVDRRVILEARRLLAHTDRTAAQIAADLGFSSATNFGKFFLRGTGETPAAFRERA